MLYTRLEMYADIGTIITTTLVAIKPLASSMLKKLLLISWLNCTPYDISESTVVRELPIKANISVSTMVAIMSLPIFIPDLNKSLEPIFLFKVFISSKAELIDTDTSFAAPYVDIVMPAKKDTVIAFQFFYYIK